jgi:predicted flap endonuclease-1-like 5' DNA nuclease
MRKTDKANKIVDLKKIQKLKKEAQAAHQKKLDDHKAAVLFAQQEKVNSILNGVQAVAEQAANENADAVRVMRIEASDCQGYFYRDDIKVLEGVAKTVADKLAENGVKPYVDNGYLRFDIFPSKK